MNRLYTAKLGFHTIAVLAENEKEGNRLMRVMIDGLTLELVDKHEDHTIATIESDDKQTVHLYCDTCNHLFFKEDNLEDGFDRPIGFVWDDKR